MKCLLSVCLIASLAAAIVHVVERPVNASQETTPTLQRGVSVELASAKSAQPMPAADDADAWIITVTADGRLYFGVDPVTPAALRQQMIRTPRKRSQRLYVKADARASFANVQKALDAASTAEFESPVLLVSQDNPSQASPNQDSPANPGTMVSPKGLEIVMDGAASSGARAIVEVDFAQGSPLLKSTGRRFRSPVCPAV